VDDAKKPPFPLYRFHLYRRKEGFQVIGKEDIVHQIWILPGRIQGSQLTQIL